MVPVHTIGTLFRKKWKQVERYPTDLRDPRLYTSKVISQSLTSAGRLKCLRIHRRPPGVAPVIVFRRRLVVLQRRIRILWLRWELPRWRSWSLLLLLAPSPLHARNRHHRQRRHLPLHVLPVEVHTCLRCCHFTLSHPATLMLLLLLLLLRRLPSLQRHERRLLVVIPGFWVQIERPQTLIQSTERADAGGCRSVEDFTQVARTRHLEGRVQVGRGFRSGMVPEEIELGDAAIELRMRMRVVG